MNIVRACGKSLTREAVFAHLKTVGHVRFRDTGVETVEDFHDIIADVFNPTDYTYGTNDRKALSSRVSTVGIEPSFLHITQHNENIYSPRPPPMLFFGCLQNCKGGATTIRSTEAVTAQMSDVTRRHFETRGVRYWRVFTDRGFEGAQPVYKHWQDVFGADPVAAEETCKAEGYDVEWLASGALRVSFEMPAFKKLSDNASEPLFLNQAHGMHASYFDEWSPFSELSPLERPFCTSWGDGTNFEEDVIEELHALHEPDRIIEAWQPGDMMFLDNGRWSHGREPFTEEHAGERQILVSVGA